MTSRSQTRRASVAAINKLSVGGADRGRRGEAKRRKGFKVKSSQPCGTLTGTGQGRGVGDDEARLGLKSEAGNFDEVGWMLLFDGRATPRCCCDAKLR